MRHLIFWMLLLLFTLLATAQETKQDARIPEENLLKMCKKQRTVGKILLGVGASLLTVGAVFPQGELIEDYSPDRHMYDRLKEVLITSGVICAVTSIPFFIVSNKNRRRAAFVGFNIEKTKRLICRDLVFNSIPAFTLKVSL